LFHALRITFRHRAILTFYHHSILLISNLLRSSEDSRLSTATGARR